jgi:Mrp family chromosome partitioning ATPase
MELRRLGKALSERWAFVVGLALLGVVAAVALGGVASRNQAELYEASAPIRFNPTEGETIADLADDIATAHNLAVIAADDLLQTDSSLDIVEDLAEARLLFVAQGSSIEEAENKALALRQSYLNVDPLVGGEAIDQRLQEIQVKADDVQSEIDTLQPEIPEEDPDLAAQRSLLEAEVTAVTDRIVELAVLEGSALDTQTRQAIVAESADQEDKLGELRAQLATLPEAPSAVELTPAESLRLASLQAQLDALTADYERLSLRQEGVTGEGLEQVTTLDLTPEPLAPIATASIGLLGGLLIAVLTLVFINRTRRPVWLAEEIGVPVLGSAPSRRVNSDTSENWYDTAEPGPRKAAVQALRAAVEAQISAPGATIAVTGLGVPPEGVQALAADLASSMASAGSSVLIIDANFDSRSSLGRYRGDGSAVSDVLSMSPMAAEFEASVSRTIESAQRVAPGLAVIPSGPSPASPADALAGRQFRHLIAEGREVFDVVLVVVDEIDAPSAQVVLQRLGHGLLVLTPGNSTRSEVDRVLRDVDRLRIALLGAVFLEKQGRFFPIRHGSDRGESHRGIEGVNGDDRDEGPSPISRLHSYPIPDERKSSLVPHGSLDVFAANLGTDSKGLTTSSELADSLLFAIRNVDPARAASSVREYLVPQTEDMVLARHGQGGLSSELTGAMSHYGFMSLKPLRGLRTPAEWLRHEVLTEVGEVGASELLEEMERALGHGTPYPIDAWLSAEFFRRHLERLKGEPEVCHLTSPGGSVSVLVPLRGLSAERLELIAAEVVERTLDEYDRARSVDSRETDWERAAVTEGQLQDARAFERIITSLTGSEVEPLKRDARSLRWKPDWTKGTRGNLASLQEAGLLPFEVLSYEEMTQLLVSA